jgi:hypothetical protein
MTRISFLLAILMAASVTAYVRGEKPVLPKSYSKVGSDGRFLFVMLVPPPYDREDRDPTLRKKYPQSGLYCNDGSREPLWIVGEEYARMAYPASDGVHLVCVSEFGGGFESWRQALRFYASGRLKRAYSVDDLTVSWLLKGSPSGKIWLRKDQFDEAAMQYTVWTSDGNSFTFDIRTGKIVSSFVLRQWGIVILLSVGVVVLVSWFLFRHRRRAGTAI